MPSFLFPDTQTFYPPSSHTIAPAAAATATLWDGMNTITGAATLATLTTMMPPNPISGEVVTIIPTVAVTALTMKDAAGNAVAGAPTALVANTQVRMLWNGTAWTKLS
jgi:hypothetical protein